LATLQKIAETHHIRRYVWPFCHLFPGPGAALTQVMAARSGFVFSGSLARRERNPKSRAVGPP
jgi:hypothetical protein